MLYNSLYGLKLTWFEFSNEQTQSSRRKVRRRREPLCFLVGRAMGVESRGSRHRARLQAAGVRHVGKWRQSLALAEADQRQLETARDQGADIKAAVARLPAEVFEGKAQRVEEYIEVCGDGGDTFRVRFKHCQEDYAGPCRMKRTEAVEDAKKLLTAADISVAALKSAHKKLTSERTDVSLEKALLEAMSYWLKQGSTSDGSRLSKAVKSRLSRLKEGSEEAQSFDAAKLLVEAHMEMEGFVSTSDVSADWLREMGLQWRFDSGSRPRGTSNRIESFYQTGLQNLGNSCFLNAVVQCILARQPLKRDLSATVPKGPLRKCMEDVTQRLQSEEWDYIAPWALLRQMYLTDFVKFPPGQSADCSDCCEILLATAISDRNLYVSSVEATGWVWIYSL